jgi:hypothetical protein
LVSRPQGDLQGADLHPGVESTVAYFRGLIEHPQRQALRRDLIGQHLKITSPRFQGNEDGIGRDAGSQSPLSQQIHCPYHEQGCAFAEGEFATLQRAIEYP